MDETISTIDSSRISISHSNTSSPASNSEMKRLSRLLTNLDLFRRCHRWRKSHNVKTTGGLLTPPAVAVICVIPALTPVATPLLLIVATFGALLAQ
jgi:hypothetical protein